MKNKITNILNKLTLCLALSFIVICLSGCVTVDSYMTIDRQGNAEIKELTMFPKELTSMVSPKLSELEEQLSSDDTTTFEKAETDSEIGAMITKVIKNVADNDINFDKFFLNNTAKPNLEGDRYIIVDKGFFKTKYYIDFNINFNKDIEYTEAVFKIDIPVAAISNNASRVDEKSNVYYWNITEPQQNISLEYEIANIFNILLCVTPVLAIILAIIVLILIKVFKKTAKILCPHCGEKVNANDKKCKFCGEDLEVKNQE